MGYINDRGEFVRSTSQPSNNNSNPPSPSGGGNKNGGCGGIILVIIIISALLQFCSSKSNYQSTNTVTNPTPTQSTNSYSRCSTNPNAYCFRRGDRGEEVRQLISDLTCLGYYSGVNDGIFGSKTEKGLKNFQRDHGLVVDGIAGIKTRNLLSQKCKQ